MHGRSLEVGGEGVLYAAAACSTWGAICSIYEGLTCFGNFGIDYSGMDFVGTSNCCSCCSVMRSSAGSIIGCSVTSRAMVVASGIEVDSWAVGVAPRMRVEERDC